MNTILILTIVLGVIPAASAWFGVDSRELEVRRVRSLVS
jgi:hypothetical protein